MKNYNPWYTWNMLAAALRPFKGNCDPFGPGAGAVQSALKPAGIAARLYGCLSFIPDGQNSNQQVDD